MSEAAIEIEHLAKRYGRFEALAGVSLEVPRGAVFGLLGPNGAGKSTLVKALLTIVRPSECRGSMLGRPIGHRTTLSRVGYLPEHSRFPEYLTGRQIVEFSGRLAKVGTRRLRERVGPLLEQVGMADWADRRNGTYSKGMRQRVGIAQALVNEPELVFLDEPTDGVDPQGRVEIRKMIEAMRAAGRTVFVNSHLLGEVEQVADRVAIVSRGRIIESGTVAELTRRGTFYELRTLGPVPFELKDQLESGGARVFADRIEVAGEDARAIQPAIDLLRGSGVPIREIRESRSSLEEVFLEAVNRQGEVRQ